MMAYYGFDEHNIRKVSGPTAPNVVSTDPPLVSTVIPPEAKLRDRPRDKNTVGFKAAAADCAYNHSTYTEKVPKGASMRTGVDEVVEASSAARILLQVGTDPSAVNCGGLRPYCFPALPPFESITRTSIGGRNYTDEHLKILRLIEEEVLLNATEADHEAFDLPLQVRTLTLTNIFKFHLLRGTAKMVALAIEKGIDYHSGAHANIFDGKIDSRIVAAMIRDIDDEVLTKSRKYSKVLLALTAEGCEDPDCAWTYATFTSENIERLLALALAGHDVRNCNDECCLAQASTSSWAVRDVIRSPPTEREASRESEPSNVRQEEEEPKHNCRSRGRPAAAAANQPSSSRIEVVRSTKAARQMPRESEPSYVRQEEEGPMHTHRTRGCTAASAAHQPPSSPTIEEVRSITPARQMPSRESEPSNVRQEEEYSTHNHWSTGHPAASAARQPSSSPIAKVPSITPARQMSPTEAEFSSVRQEKEEFSAHSHRSRGRPAAAAAHQPFSSTTIAEVQSTKPARHMHTQSHEHFSYPCTDSSNDTFEAQGNALESYNPVDRIELAQEAAISSSIATVPVRERHGSVHGTHEWLMFSDILEIQGNVMGSDTDTEISLAEAIASSTVSPVHNIIPPFGTHFPFPASPARTVPRTVPRTPPRWASPSTAGVVTRGSKKGAVPSSPSSYQKYPASTWAYTEVKEVKQVKRQRPDQQAPYHTYTPQQESIPADNMAHHNTANPFMDMEAGDSYPQYMPDPYGTSTFAHSNSVERWRPEEHASSHTYTQHQEYGSGKKIRLSDGAGGAGRGKRRAASDVGGSSTLIRGPDVHLLKLKKHKRSATDESCNQTSSTLAGGRNGDKVDNRNERIPAQQYSDPLVYSTASKEPPINTQVESPSTVNRRKWSDYMPASGEL